VSDHEQELQMQNHTMPTCYKLFTVLYKLWFAVG